MRLAKVKSFFTPFRLVILLVFSFAAFVRIYRTGVILGFWYDQGRDALVIWDFLHKGKLFLVGPTTGIEGIFRGPWYYWLITPFYLLGRGNPVWPAVFLAISSILALYILYKLGKELEGKWTGILALFIGSFSYYVVTSSRWLSNPTPMLLVSVALIWSIFKFIRGAKWGLPLISFLCAMAVQFGSAAEIFYLPATLIVLYWKRKNLPSIKIIGFSVIIFFLAFVPQIIFDIRHRGVLLGAINKFLFEEKSFSLSFWQILQSRSYFYYKMLSSKFWINGEGLFAPFFVLCLYALVKNINKLWQNPNFRVLTLFTLAPFVGMLFFQGNRGNVYEYYFTGYYLIFILFFSYLLVVLAKSVLGKAVLFCFLAVFVFLNSKDVSKYLATNVNEPTAVFLGNQKMALDWIYKDVGQDPFNVDVYVPPVIPYAYDYLFNWLGSGKYDRVPDRELVGNLYTIYEVDIPHPERLDAWLNRQIKIGRVIKEERFGGIIVQRRMRF
ncbi:MAG TPA: glycosyltransferase family 39 protein [Patescibacteria group bacterium]|nr:glycosyltransferase family 39 protein [Patescibacteria group bacterium]